MRFRDKKIHNRQVNAGKINNVLNKCDCSLIGFAKDANGYNRYTIFESKAYQNRYTIETKKIGFDNVMAVINESEEAL